MKRRTFLLALLAPAAAQAHSSRHGDIAIGQAAETQIGAIVRRKNPATEFHKRFGLERDHLYMQR